VDTQGTVKQQSSDFDNDNVGKVVDCSKAIVSLLQGMDIANAPNKLKQIVAKVQSLQQLCEDVTFTMEASQGNHIIDASVALQQQTLEFVKVVRVTLDFNEVNYIEAEKTLKHYLTTLVKLIIYPSKATAPVVEPTPAPITTNYDNPFNNLVKDIVSKNKAVTEMLENYDFDENAFLSLIKSIVTSAKKSVEYTVDVNLQNTLVDSTRILLQNSIAFKSSRSLETKSNLLASLTSLVHSLISAGAV